MSLRRRYLIVSTIGLVFVVGATAILIRRELLAPVGGTPWVLLPLGLCGFLLIWLGGRFIEASSANQIRDLSGRVRRMAEGEFQNLPSRSNHPEDLEELAAALRAMAEQVAGSMEELERERDEARRILDSIAEGVMALTSDARVLRMNAPATELLDAPRAPAFPPIGALVRHPQLREYLEASVVRALAPQEFRIGERHLLISSHLLPDGGSVVTMLEVTKLRQIEEIRRDFVANASHELRTPLTAVRGFAETLLQGETPEELRRQFLDKILNNTLRMQYLVDDLLDLSRVESGTWILAENEIDVATLAREVWDHLGTEQGPEDVEFSVEGEVLALGDEQALHLIFRNLFDNALRYTPKGGRIWVRVAGSGPAAQVSVEDSGSGIPSSALPRIFERFYRADSGRDRETGGTGLGLAIVRHLVESMGGEVSVESELGRGATIRFSLPRVTGGA